MATVVRTLEDLGYGWAYRVVDGRDHGTPQRRGRVLVVGHRGGDPRPAWKVLGDTDRAEKLILRVQSAGDRSDSHLLEALRSTLSGASQPDPEHP